MSSAVHWEVPASLRPAYEVCRDITQRHARTYYLAATLLPGPRRPHVWALYAFARVSDDLVDEPTGDPAQDLAAWRAATIAALRPHGPAPDPQASPVLAALRCTRECLGLGVGAVEEFLDSMAMDLHVGEYATYADLRRYMRGSAAVIGEMTAPLLGASGEAAMTHAAALGEAFQFTNFVRDVAEDRGRGRTYLPLEDLARHAVTVAELDECVRTRRPTPAVRRLLADEVDRGLHLYELARPGLNMVDGRCQPCVAVAFDLYRQILVQIRQCRYDVFAGRIVVPTLRRGTAVLGAFSRYARLGSSRGS